MPYVAHVDAYLMGTAGFEHAFHYGHRPQRLNGPVVCHGVFAIVTGRKYIHLKAVAQRTAYIAFDASVGGVGTPPYNGYVFTLGGLVEELLSKVGLGIGSLCHHQQSGGVLVDAVHKSHTRVGHIVVWVILEVPCQGIHQSAAVVAVSRMHHQSRRFVHHQQEVVFVNNVEGNVLGYNLKIVAWTVHHHLYHIERLYAVVAFHRFAVDEYTACLGSLLHTVAR